MPIAPWCGWASARLMAAMRQGGFAGTAASTASPAGPPANQLLRSGGSGRARVRLAVSAGVLLAVTVVASVGLNRWGRPARIVAGSEMEGIVINNVRPVQLPVRVLNAAGRELKAGGVRFQWKAGVPIAVSPTGEVTCTQHGDAKMEASLGQIAAVLDVRCRPVREIQTSAWISLVAGEPARDLPFRVIGTDGSFVTELRGEARVTDSSVATLVGATIRPRAVGEAEVFVQVGDRNARFRVLVHEPVRAFAGLHADQRLVALPVRLAQGDTVQWALPHGVFWLKYFPRREGDAPPTITVRGGLACAGGDGLRVYLLPLDEHGTYCIRHVGDASVILAHGRMGAPVVDGWLALEFVKHR